MRHFSTLVITIVAMLIISLLPACSKSKSPIEPAMGNPDSPVPVAESNSTRTVLAVYDATIDPVAKSLTVPLSKDRIADFHLPLTNYYPNALKITAYGWTPNFWADIKLNHPFPGSGIDAFDPRVIAILPANPGVSFNYPIFNCVGNNSVVLEPDAYTKLFDSLGGSIPGNTNPFKAYFKDQPNRVWSSTGVTSETQRWQMKLTGFGGSLTYKLVVDVSTNYPNPPQPVIDNAPEPVQIETLIGQGMTHNGGNANIEVTFLDWQGDSNIKCKIESPSLFSSAIQLFYSRPGTNPNEYIFSGTISNDLLAPEGDYGVLIAAWDIPSDVHVFQETIAIVKDEITFNPVDVTPPWLNFSPRDVFVEGDYAYVAGGINGLHIFDISNPVNPVWVNKVDTEAYRVYVSGGCAYVTGLSTLQIIDINSPQSPYIVKTVDMPEGPKDIYVTFGYAYVADNKSGLLVLDIDPPGEASIVKIVDTPGHAFGVFVTGGYAYVADDNKGLQIIDIEPLDNASIVRNVPLMSGGYASAVYVRGSYAFVAASGFGFQIINVDPPENASFAYQIYTGRNAIRVCEDNGYVYILNGYGYPQPSGVQIFDVDPPEDSYVVKNVDTPPSVNGFNVADGYIYIADTSEGLDVIDIDPLEDASLVKTVNTPSQALGISVSGGLAYVADGEAGLDIINVDPPENAKIMKRVSTPENALDISTSGGYAYIAAFTRFLIIDLDPPESARVVNDIQTSVYARHVSDSGGYAYVVGDGGYQKFDVEPPESASSMGFFGTSNDNAIYATGNYIYIMGSQDDGQYSEFEIISVEPHQSVKHLSTPTEACGAFVVNGYAYVADYRTGLLIIDVDPPENASIVSTVLTPAGAWDVFVSGNYAYVADSESGLQIIDIRQPNPSIVKSIAITGQSSSVFVNGGYAYVGGNVGGLRIIKLW